MLIIIIFKVSSQRYMTTLTYRLGQKNRVSLRIINNLKSSIGHKIQIIGDGYF